MTVGRNGRISGMIGLAAKAGRVQSGGYATEKSIKTGKARLCIVAMDASEESKSTVKKMCEAHSIEFCMSDINKDELGHMIGKGARTSITIEDMGFADSVKKLIEGGKESD